MRRWPGLGWPVSSSNLADATARAALSGALAATCWLRCAPSATRARPTSCSASTATGSAGAASIAAGSAKPKAIPLPRSAPPNSRQ